MQLIGADIGNSSTKIAVASNLDQTLSTVNDRWSSKIRLPNETSISLEPGELKLPEQPSFWSVSSVNSLRANELRGWVKKNRPNDQFHLINESAVDLESDVESRKQLGRDRLVAAWMAVQLNEGSGPIITVDAGTAVTIDLIDKCLVFRGGHIFPGADTCFAQLAQDTDALPSLSRERRSELLVDLKLGAVGKSTDQAILNGVYQSQITGIIGIVEAMSKSVSKQPDVYLTGGGIHDISNFLPDSWHRVPDLVLRGAIGIGHLLTSASKGS